MRRKIRIIGLILLLAFSCFIGYWFFEASEFASGIKEDTTKRDSILKEKGVRLDSLGNVKYEDYQKIIDSLEKKK